MRTRVTGKCYTPTSIVRRPVFVTYQQTKWLVVSVTEMFQDIFNRGNVGEFKVKGVERK